MHFMPAGPRGRASGDPKANASSDASWKRTAADISSRADARNAVKAYAAARGIRSQYTAPKRPKRANTVNVYRNAEACNGQCRTLDNDEIRALGLEPTRPESAPVQHDRSIDDWRARRRLVGGW